MTAREGKSNAAQGRFATTHWSLVVAAGGRAAPDAQQALATLCESYWSPLYFYVRRAGYSAADAQDLTQAFFLRVLEKDYLATADRQRGKFRSFLLAALKHFLSHQRDRARAQKRGGGKTLLSLDFTAAEQQYGREPADDVTPQRLFERRWAVTLLDQVLALLQSEYADRGKGALFEVLKEFIAGDSDARPYGQVAAELGMTEGSVKVAVHRLRRRYRDLLRTEIAHTVTGSEEEVEEELRDLFSALRAS